MTKTYFLLSPNTTATFPIHFESLSYTARSAIRLQSDITTLTQSLLVTLRRNDETNHEFFSRVPLSTLVQQGYTTLETLEPHTFRDYVFVFEPTDSAEQFQNQSTPLTIHYGLEYIASPSPSPSPLVKHTVIQRTAFTEIESAPLPSPTPFPSPQVLGVSTEIATPSSWYAIPPVNPPLIFVFLLSTGVLFALYFTARFLILRYLQHKEERTMT